jgi:DnaJ like chaperone protein
MMHLLFGVSNADGEIHPLEIQTLEQIAEYMGVQMGDFSSIMAMFVKDTTSAYRVLEVESTTSIEDIKKAYRRLAVLHHPDKVHHLGADFQKDAQEKFKQINEAYDQIKKERGFK